MSLSNIFPSLRYSPLFMPLRNAYLRTLKPDHWNTVKRQHAFYRNFVRPGSLVFDIGANEGVITGACLALGAGRVIAVEPVQSCVGHLRMIHGPVTVVEAAVGAREYIARIYVASEATHFSTLSNDWLNIAKKSKRFSDATWDRELHVQVVTLDWLIATYGHPDFIKIDVEGYELEVLSGLGSLACPLTFEFNSENRAVAEKCIALPLFRDAEFNFGCDYQLMLDKWVGADELLPLITGVAADICVRPK